MSIENSAHEKKLKQQFKVAMHNAISETMTFDNESEKSNFIIELMDLFEKKILEQKSKEPYLI